MKYYKDTLGTVYGYDADQSSLIAQAIAAGWTDVTGAWPPPQVPQPNTSGFITACKTAMGGIVGANTLALKYPLWLPALQSSDWTDAQALMIAAHTAGDINATEYAAMQAAVTANNIPITLP